MDSYVRKSEQLQNDLATQEIRWKFNMGKSPWWSVKLKDSVL